MSRPTIDDFGFSAAAFHPRHALLTGAAGAIGGALTRVLAERHHELRFSLVDRDAQGLSALSELLGERGSVWPWDLAEPSTLPALWERATGRFGAVDLLVNCAGIMEIRSFAATPWELGDRLMQVDLMSPLRLMNLAVLGMRGADGSGAQRPHGWVVNVSSMAGRVPLRGCSYYGAAKAGLAVASQIAGMELQAAGIHVLTVLPGPVRSGLESRARAQVQQGLVSRRIPTGDPTVLADRIERALRRGRRRLIYPGIYRIGDRMLGASSWLAESFGPEPTDAPQRGTTDNQTT